MTHLTGLEKRQKKTINQKIGKRKATSTMSRKINRILCRSHAKN